jgi:hypothetical protein
MAWVSGLYGRRRGRARGGFGPGTVEVLEIRALMADGIAPSPGAALTGTAGVPLTNVPVATFTVTDPSGAPGTKWDSLIEWGDGQHSALVPATAGPNNTFQFLGTHAYAAAGTYTITVMIAVPGSQKPNDNTVTTTAVIRNAAALQSIAVAPADPAVTKGGTQQFNATGTFSDGSSQDLTGRVAWASANIAVATISGTGLASALSPGSSAISASLDGVTGSTVLTVNPPPFPVAGLQFQARALRAFNHVVATFSEPRTRAQDFHASIDWGDGSGTTRGTVRGQGIGRFAVVGAHRYGRPGVYQVTVTVVDRAGRASQGVSRINVRR